MSTEIHRSTKGPEYVATQRLTLESIRKMGEQSQTVALAFVVNKEPMTIQALAFMLKGSIRPKTPLVDAIKAYLDKWELQGLVERVVWPKVERL